MNTSVFRKAIALVSLIVALTISVYPLVALFGIEGPFTVLAVNSATVVFALAAVEKNAAIARFRAVLCAMCVIMITVVVLSDLTESFAGILQIVVFAIFFALYWRASSGMMRDAKSM